MYVILTRKRMMTALVLCAAMVLGVVGLSLARSVATVPVSGDWGLHFGREGETPIGNVGADGLAQYGAYYCGDPTEKRIYLTFDAGYENGYTAAILDTLKSHQVP